MERNYPHDKRHRYHDDRSLFQANLIPRGIAFGIRRGDFLFLVLISLSEKPMHGYALIQEIGRTYLRPVSAGLIYPTLQELEDMGYVSQDSREGKKI